MAPPDPRLLTPRRLAQAPAVTSPEPSPGVASIEMVWLAQGAVGITALTATEVPLSAASDGGAGLAETGRVTSTMRAVAHHLHGPHARSSLVATSAALAHPAATPSGSVVSGRLLLLAAAVALCLGSLMLAMHARRARRFHG